MCFQQIIILFVVKTKRFFSNDNCFFKGLVFRYIFIRLRYSTAAKPHTTRWTKAQKYIYIHREGRFRILWIACSISTKEELFQGPMNDEFILHYIDTTGQIRERFDKCYRYRSKNLARNYKHRWIYHDGRCFGCRVYIEWEEIARSKCRIITMPQVSQG